MSLKEDFSVKRFSGFICTNLICILIHYHRGYFNYNQVSPIDINGYFIAISVYLLKMIAMIGSLTYAVFVIGTTFFRDVKDKTNKIPIIPQKSICFRVVTRGTYPKLVKKNLEYNISVLKGFEKLKYTYEVVTDNKIGDINTIERCYEVVVPEEYSTKTSAKFKARALQYAMEQNVSDLDVDDLVVHLDEETRISKSAVIGIINFANQNKHQIGQGNKNICLNITINIFMN
jgi:egghead protein (zeste-white 4 protein)